MKPHLEAVLTTSSTLPVNVANGGSGWPSNATSWKSNAVGRRRLREESAAYVITLAKACNRPASTATTCPSTLRQPRAAGYPAGGSVFPGAFGREYPPRPCPRRVAGPCRTGHSPAADAATAQPATQANPFFAESPLPLHYPQFDKIKDSDFAPARRGHGAAAEGSGGHRHQGCANLRQHLDRRRWKTVAPSSTAPPPCSSR